MDRLKELAYLGANDPQPQSQLDSLAEEVNGIKRSLVDLANTRDAEDRYVFGGTRSGAPPYREEGSRDPVEAAKVLLAAKANPNAKAPDGSTVLHQAVRNQQVVMIRTLVEAGASLDAVNKDKLTPLGLATTMKGDPPARGKKDSKEQTIAVLRELMHLGPDDPVPGLPADKKDSPAEAPAR